MKDRKRPRLASILATLGGGSLAAGLAGLGAFLLVTFSLHSAYYYAVLLPLAAGLYGLLAWILHLRDDGLAKRQAPEDQGGTRGAQAVLGVAALELLALATALYSLGGVGASL